MKTAISLELNNNPMTQQPEILNEEYLVQRKNGLTYKKYAKGPFTGLVEEFYENNNPFILRPFPCRTRNFRFGKLDGLSEWFKENGRVTMRRNYKNGEPDGLWEAFYKSGQLNGIYNYKNGELDGLCEIFYENGQLRRRQNYKNGKQHGSSKGFYENGQLEFRENLKNGEKHGLWESFYKSGQLRNRYNYKNGEPDGVCEEFYSNGQLANRGNYKNGKQHGVWERSLGGTELKRDYYRNGELLNLWVIYCNVRDYFREQYIDTLAYLSLTTILLVVIVWAIFHVPYIKITGKSCKSEFCNVHSSHKS